MWGPWRFERVWVAPEGGDGPFARLRGVHGFQWTQTADPFADEGYHLQRAALSVEYSLALGVVDPSALMRGITVV